MGGKESDGTWDDTLGSGAFFIRFDSGALQL